MPREKEKVHGCFHVEVVQYEFYAGVDDFLYGEVVGCNEKFVDVVVVNVDFTGVDVRKDVVDRLSCDAVVDLWLK